MAPVNPLLSQLGYPDDARLVIFHADEYVYFRSQRLRDFLAREQIIPIGYRAICDIMRGTHA